MWVSLPSPTSSPPILGDLSLKRRVLCVNRTKNMRRATQRGGSHVDNSSCFVLISLHCPFWSKPLVAGQKDIIMARNSLPTEQGTFSFVQQCPRSAIVPGGKQPRLGLSRHCWPLSPCSWSSVTSPGNCNPGEVLSVNSPGYRQF